MKFSNVFTVLLAVTLAFSTLQDHGIPDAMLPSRVEVRVGEEEEPP